MARIARIVVPGIPHHNTQRGNRRMQMFFSDEDYQEYISWISASTKRYGVDVWAYCLMPNHVHLIAVPIKANSFRLGIGETHRRYTRRINFREKWKGHLWQERFASYPMSEEYLISAARYVESNPIRAKITEEPWAYKWSSAAAHMKGQDDELVRVQPLLELVNDWQALFYEDVKKEEVERLHLHERTGRPLGDVDFIGRIENMICRVLQRQKPGPKKTSANS